MDANVITKIEVIFLLLGVLLILGCNNGKIPLAELNNLQFDGKSGTYNFSMQIKGKTSCPVKIIILRDNKRTSLMYSFNGVIDTLIVEDWYEEKMSFEVHPVDCIEKGTFVKVKLYD
jgi:hypothetical protein